MEAKIEIEIGANNIIRIIDDVYLLERTYYPESYLKEMMQREYKRGLREGRTVHIAETVIINKREP